MERFSQNARHNSHNSHACNLCRQKKRRCNWTQENQTCSTCRKAGTSCEISLTVKTRVKGTRRRQVHDLEARVRQMESLLTESGLLATLTPSATPSEIALVDTAPIEAAPLGLEPTETTEVVPSIEYFATDFEFPSMDQHEHLWMGAQDQELPPPQEAALLLQEYLEDWNKAIPLFERAALGQIFQDCYIGREREDSTAWAVVAVVLALAHKLRGMSPIATSSDTACADRHKERLLKMVPSLLMQDPSLQVVQCLVGIGLLLYMDVDNNRAHVFITMALRLMEPLGMDCCSNVNLVDQWKSVFWVAYAIDTDLALRWCRMPSRRSEDVAKIALPKPSEQGRIYSAEGEWTVDYLLLRAELSLIQARVCEKLLRSFSNDAANDLLQDLQQWRSHWIFNRSPRELTQHLHRSDIVTLSFLEASYHHTIFSIRTHVTLLANRAAPIYDGDTLVKLCKEKVQPCLEDSRRFFEFIRILPRGEVSWVFAVSQAMVSSVVVLLANATANPSDPLVAADMDIARSVLELMRRLSSKCRHPDCRQIWTLCQQLYEQTGLSRRKSLSC